MIGSDQLPSSRHVLHNNTRIAGQMFAETACRHAAVGIESAAGSGANDHHDGFPFEELLSRGWNRSDQEQCRCADDLYTVPKSFGVPVGELRIGKSVLGNGAKRKISLAELAARAAATGRTLRVSANF
jgi:hypothetical protein